jgi:Cofactor assembly of complex C subunit B, CCB2/CCB4
VQVAPVVSASSSQSRADVLLIVMSAILALTGLNWLSLKSKTPERAELQGVEAAYLDANLPAEVRTELLW